MHEPNVWYHVAHPKWQPGQPLYCWNRVVELGILTPADWAHPRVPVGMDGDMISLFDDLENARQHASNKPVPGEHIVRIRFPPGEEDIGFTKCEDVTAYRGCEIPAAWLEVVGDDEEPWMPPEARSDARP
jgi:hypothetical protein